MTFRDALHADNPKQEGVKEDYSNTNDFAQIDVCIANRKAWNAVENVETDTKSELDTDHFPLITKMKIKLQKEGSHNEEHEVWKNLENRKKKI